MCRRTIDRIILGWVALIILVALIGNVSLAASNGGRTAADFLQIGVGASAAGMGGAYTAVAEGAEGAYWNPAMLTATDGRELSLSHFSWYQDLKLEHGAYAHNLNERTTIAASMTYLGYGTIEGYDRFGNSSGEVTAYDWVGGLSVGYAINDRVSAGVTWKYVTQKLHTTSASAMAADFGLRYQWDRITVGAVAANIGSDMTFETESEHLPAAARIAVAVVPFDYGFRTAIEFEKRFYGDAVIRHGVELNFEQRYFLRTGYNFYLEDESNAFSDGLSLGAGLQYGSAQLDYAFTLKDRYSSESLHRFSVKFMFGG